MASDIGPSTLTLSHRRPLRVCVLGLGGGGFHAEVARFLKYLPHPMELVLVYAGPNGGILYWDEIPGTRVVAACYVRSPMLFGDSLWISPWRFVTGLLRAAAVLARWKPDVVLGVATPQFLCFAVAALCFRTECWFVETITRVRTPSTTGKLVARSRLATRFFYWWPGLSRYYRGTRWHQLRSFS